MLQLSLLQSAPAIVIGVVIFMLIIVFYLAGYRIGQGRHKKNPDGATAELGAINGTLLGLLGLLLAFTFGMASSRFDTRRQVIIEEANDIGTVILRAEIYPDSLQQLLRHHLKDYVEARIGYYAAGTDDNKVIAFSKSTDSISKLLWTIVANQAKKENIATLTSEMIPALNAMIDIVTTRRAAGESNIPDSIMYFLFILCASSAFLLGYDNRKKIDWIVVMGLAIMLSATVFTITDLDRPRNGLISMDKPNQKIIELREMFK